MKPETKTLLVKGVVGYGLFIIIQSILTVVFLSMPFVALYWFLLSFK